ncbi:Phytanoyl-CoA dioxygenase (PhyH) [Rosistilla oblonga]|uniref:phytanoyl-CoA dioxygenase family protein n=1 Tax=Rosistilla oblonga TaxID=2527990 RepID=UPI00118D0EB9|nr:phytanoyl-CoA dioxygenase family protein [Rosistilla oblonga]QDV11933.1 Phytanoyl-CoA dioxygenase (PhyH) [Rosistilla oblonga]
MDELVDLAKGLNPSFTLPDAWQQQLQTLSRNQGFLYFAKQLLRSERNQSYFHPRHFKKTVEQKASLSFADCRLLTALLARVFPERIEWLGQTGVLGAADQAVVRSAADAVEEDGVFVLPQRLSHESLEAIHSALSRKTFRNRSTKQTASGVSPQSGLHGAWWVSDTADLATCSAVQALALDPTLLGIAQSVLGAAPIHAQTNAWWSFPLEGDATSEATQKRNAQWFHQDMEFIDFVKVFVYLSDVGQDNGPHVYVKGSARDYEDKLPGVKLSARVSDEAIQQAFGADRIQAITGESGTIAIVNTRGYHKGASVLRGHRLLLQFEYASSLYFNPVPAFSFSDLSDANQRLREQVPRVFQNYRERAGAPSRGGRGFMSRIAGLLKQRPKAPTKAA